MKILMLNHNVAWSGGTFFRAYHFARQMARRNHDVTLLTISRARRTRLHEYVKDRVRIVETPDLLWGRGRTGWDPWDTLRRAWFVRTESWDLVHCFDSRPAVILPALPLQSRGVPLVMDWADWWGRGGTIQERTTGPLVRVLFAAVETYFEEAFRHRVDGTTVIGSALFRRALSLGVPAGSIVRLPSGSDVEGIQPLPRHACRRELGLPETQPIVGYLGVLIRSDAQLLFDTFARLRQVRADCTLLLIGNHQARIPDRRGILETGFVPHHQLGKLLAACDLMLLPMKDTVASRGRWPSKLNDYLAAGRPVAATAVGDVGELFAKHAIGLATADSPAELAAAAHALLSDPARLASLGHNARHVAETEFAWPKLAEELEQHYLRILSATRQSSGHSPQTGFLPAGDGC